MSNIATLPLVRVIGSVEPNEDLTFSLTFTLADGVTPLPLAGIAFTLAVNYPSLANLFTGSTADSTLAIGGASGNVLSCTIRAAATALWPPGDFLMTLIATDGTATKGVFSDSALSIGETQAWSFTVVMPSGATATGSTGTGGVSPATTIVTASQAIVAPGLYVVTMTGVTLTLASPAAVSGNVTVKDMTGNASPNILINGATINGGSSFTLTSAYQAVTLAPIAPLSAWGTI